MSKKKKLSRKRLKKYCKEVLTFNKRRLTKQDFVIALYELYLKL